MPECAGAILAGGLGSRMGHVDKSRLPVGGRAIVERLLAAFDGLFSEILIAAKDPGLFTDLVANAPTNSPIKTVPDLIDKRGSLTGLHAVLSQAKASHCFVTACDAPFVSPRLIALMLSRLEPEDDVLIPRKPDGYLEPLCAVYSKRCLPYIQAQLAVDRFKIVDFFSRVRVREIAPEDVLTADPELISFFNVNTPGDLELAQVMERPGPAPRGK